MSIFQLKMRVLDDRQFAADWFDNDDRLWDDDRLHRGSSVVTVWRAPRLKVFRRTERLTDVLFNPNAIAVSAAICDRFRKFSGVEFLPIEVEGEAPFFIMHVTALVDPPPDIAVRRAPPPSGNIVEIYRFPAGYTGAGPLFRVRQPADSAAGRRAYCFNEIYANDEGARALEVECGLYFLPVAVGG